MRLCVINHHFKHYLPYLIVIVGILASILICLGIVYFPFIHIQDGSLPWVILASGIVITLLGALAIQLIQLIKQRTQSLASIHQDIKKEIAERIHAEETKQKLEKALLQSQKLQAIGTLAGGIAHDFNNLLYAILGYVEMAREDVEQDSLVYKNLGKALEAAHRGRDLIARILAFSRRQHHDFNPIPLQETLEGVLELLKPTIPASVSIQFITMKEDCIIFGNETQLHQVIVNIINNAVDAMYGEGTVTLKVNLIDKGDELLKQFPKKMNTGYCKIEITDTGYGMDQSTIERIFEPFFTTKEVGKGTGLGLATVHAIMTEHHGEVMVKSKLGQGTTITLLLPQYEVALVE